MEESCMTCDNGNGVGGCGYPICCIQFSEWKPIPVKMEWKPIETAPKDGIHILGYDVHNSEWFAMYWQKTFLHADGGEWAMDGMTGYDGEYDAHPTHWMPLPPPPAGSPQPTMVTHLRSNVGGPGLLGYDQ